MKSKLYIIEAVILFILANCTVSCGDSGYTKFRKAMSAGSLSDAQNLLSEIDDESECETAALQLIKAYIEVGDTKKAIDIYENITPWHRSRYSMTWDDENSYEQTVCRLLRNALLKSSDYETLWNYYPLSHDDENNPSNAKSRYVYISDVVYDLCCKGRKDEARRFVDKQLRWYTTYIDLASSKYYEEDKEQFNSGVTKERLFSQIDNYVAY